MSELRAFLVEAWESEEGGVGGFLAAFVVLVFALAAFSALIWLVAP